MVGSRSYRGFAVALVIGGGAEALTGAILCRDYKPEAPFGSVSSLVSNYNGHLLLSFHHWLSAVLLGAAAIFLLLGLLSASYASASRRLWVALVAMFLVLGLLQLTGHLLPWDQHAVRTSVIEASIAQATPGGSFAANFVRGGSQVGPQTLALWYWGHVAVFSLVWLVAACIVFRGAIKAGVSWPVANATGGVLLAGSLALAWLMPVRYGLIATTADFTSGATRPEWYVLPLHQLLVLFQSIQPWMGWIGTVVVPGIALLLVILSPWLDVRPRQGQKSIYGPVLAVCLLTAGLALFLAGASAVASPSGPNVIPEIPQQPTGPTKIDAAKVAFGKQLFDTEQCSRCHELSGASSGSAPTLEGEGRKRPSLDWQMRHLAKPDSVSPGSTMPSYGKIGTNRIEALAEYMISLK
jgi:quinol-cytochrome oxidoreductase complex cytochrome b subunit